MGKVTAGIFCAAGLVAGLVAAQVSAEGLAPDLHKFLGQQGCVIGPGTDAAATAAGFTPQDIADFLEKTEGANKGQQNSDWLLIAPEYCRIELPPITSEIGLDDPEVRESFSAVDANAADGFPGCYLDGEKLQSKLREQRGWDEERAFGAYIRFLGAGVQSGDLAFYGDYELLTPPGFVLTTGDCGQALPDLAPIQEGHLLMMKEIDPLIRLASAQVACDDPGGLFAFWSGQDRRDLLGVAYRNVWGSAELQQMAMALGWYEGMGATDRGQPRPPMCHYPAP